MKTTSHQKAGLALAALLALSTSSRDASAMGVLVGSRGHVEVLDRQVLFIRTGTTETIIETVELDRAPARFAWLRAFPTRPLRVERASERLFERLAEETAVVPPFRDEVDELKFGPSILGPILRQDPPAEAEAETAPTRVTVPFALENVTYFEGATTTSTITRKKRLPENFEQWLSAENLLVTPTQFQLLARHFDDGAVIVASVYELTRSADRVWIAPTRYVFEGSAGRYPVRPIGAGLVRSRRFELYTVAPEPLLPRLDLDWSMRPWEQIPASPPERFVVRYHQPVELGTRLAIEAEAETPVIEGHHLIAGVMKTELPPREDLQLAEVAANDAPLLPGAGRRGGAFDLFLVLILGLLPLLYTPESWLLWWIGARTREARRQDENAPTWGLLLWPLYCIAVGGYFLFTLRDAARTAALLPLLIAVVRLATPAPDKEKEYFFRWRPKKAANPRKSQAPGRGAEGRKSQAPPKTGDLRNPQDPKKTGDIRGSMPPKRPSAPASKGSMPPGSQGEG